MTVKMLFLLLALICFLLKAFSVNAGRVDFMNLGFAFIVASMIF